ncbi:MULTISPECIES: hypothetical protein [Pseudomonas]|uniref:hypothetical protein n=1 Tax=Pseudomonas TaxID=286 RepID=UPI00129BF1C2|nr:MULTISPECIES: hypothetical protein [Pseudomonas]MBH3462616.1 hypothetical protein [Pseudomonas putida]
MTDDVSLSFTATLLVNGFPLIILRQATDQPILVPHPDSSLGTLDVSSSLGVLSTPDDAWDNAREEKLVDFHVTGETTATEFYFRHGSEGYYMYVRDGSHAGQHIRKSKYGVAMAHSETDGAPSAWLIHHDHTGKQITLEDLATSFAIINLACPHTGICLANELIAQGEGAYLATRRSSPKAKLRLNILRRGVDWSRR